MTNMKLTTEQLNKMLNSEQPIMNAIGQLLSQAIDDGDSFYSDDNILVSVVPFNAYTRVCVEEKNGNTYTTLAEIKILK